MIKPAIASSAFLLPNGKGSKQMASFHFKLKSGRNGCDHASYIARLGFHAHHEDLIASGHGNLPAWANDDPRTFWKAAEIGERMNGAVYREAVIALPKELNAQQNKALVNELIERLALGKPHQFAMHAPTSSLESEPNPHLHLMMSDRVDDGIERPAEYFFSRHNPARPEAGGRKKASGGRNAMELRNDVIATREVVAETINHHLAINGHEARVDHRSLKDQGIARVPERRISAVQIEKMSVSEKSKFVADRKIAAGVARTTYERGRDLGLSPGY